MRNRSGPLTLLAAGTPATSATALEPIELSGNKVKLFVTTVTGGAGTLTITAKTSFDGSVYHDVVDRNSAWSTSTTVINTAGTYDLDLTGLPLDDGGFLKLYYACTNAAGTIAIKAVNYVDPGGSSSVETGDIIADLDTVNTNTAASATSLAVMDDWDESDRAKVNPIVGQAGIAAGAGAVAATVPRMTLASDDPAVVDLAAMEVLQTTIAGDTTSLDAKVPALGTAVMAASSPVTIATDDTMTAAANALLGTIDADTSTLSSAYTAGTTSHRKEEIDPLSAQYATVSLISNEAVATALDTSAPSTTGQAWGGYGPLSLQMYLLGGVKTGPTNVTVTVTIEATNGATVSAATDWVDITESFKSLLTGLDSVASYTSTGATAYRDILTLRREDANFTHFRVNYVFDDAPDSTNGAVVVMARGAAV